MPVARVGRDPELLMTDLPHDTMFQNQGTSLVLLATSEAALESEDVIYLDPLVGHVYDAGTSMVWAAAPMARLKVSVLMSSIGDV